MARRRNSREIAPEERLVLLALVSVGLVIAWFVWPRNVSAFEILTVLGLAIFWWQAIRRFRAVHAVYDTREQLAALTPDEFEQWCGNRLRALGFTVRHVGGQGDHGIDLFAEKNGERVVIQCKRFTGKRTVGEPQIRDLFGAMHAERAARAIVMNAGYFTAEALAWVKGKPIELWGIDRLVQLRPAAASVSAANMAATPITEVAGIHLRCGQCGSDLVVRRNRNTGDSFYGCSRYPTCRFTRPLKAQVRGAT
jgi:restriction system protein